MYTSGKIYGHNLGFSCAFRQWRAKSHCNKLHGYALQFEFTFSSEKLDIYNWVVDFGSLKSLKAILEDNFDHKTLVAEDDPDLRLFEQAHEAGVIDLNTVPATGCEMFARMVYEIAEQWLRDSGHSDIKLDSVVVREHGANWASYSCHD